MSIASTSVFSCSYKGIPDRHAVLVSATSGSQMVPGIFAVLEHAGIPVQTLSIRSPSLEDIFLYLTGGRP
ncbi:hypothetical protein [Methanoregula sp.]|uniref:hypothetical protein n=1 Tax=Methanoregula sp. TaxID=2052170 RepID=UPI003C17C201